MGNPQPRITLQTITILRLFQAHPSKGQYGLELAKAAHLPTGTVYPILARLEQAGWLTSHWEQIDPSAEARRPRRYYRLTAVGASSAKVAIDRVSKNLFPELLPQPQMTVEFSP